MDNYSSQGSVPGFPAPAARMGRWRASKLLVHQSWDLLKRDKELLLFPVMTIVLSLGALILGVGMLVLFFVSGGAESLRQADVSKVALDAGAYVLLFIIYFVLFFITTFMQVGMVTIAYARLQGQDLTFGNGISNAFGHIGKIFIWSLVASTVGVVLKIISDRSQLIGKIVASLLGAAWGILTFFIVPILVVENISIRESLKKSAAIIRRTWGEALIINIGLGLYFFLLALVGIAVFVASFFTANLVFILVALGLMILYFIFLALVSSVLGMIIRVVLYEYANSGKIAEGFTPELIRSAIKVK